MALQQTPERRGVSGEGEVLRAHVPDLEADTEEAVRGGPAV